jgi:hypothetical protein
MAASDPPGWYRDPSQPDAMRYWDGTAWTSRHRPRPAWTGGGPDVVVPAGGALDSPIRPAEVPAPSAGLSAPSREAPSRDAPTGAGPGDAPPLHGPHHPAGQHRAPGPGGGGGGGGTPTGGGGGGGGGHDGSGQGDGPQPGRTGRSRLRWVLIATIAVTAATIVAIAGEAMRPKTPGPKVLTDLRYVRLANAKCAQLLADLRPPDTGPFGQATTPDQTAAQIDRAAAGLDDLAGQLAAVPATAVDRPHIDEWLAGWHRYTGQGRRYALFLRQNGNANPGQLINDSAREARAADNFALANGLKSSSGF